MKFYYMFSYFPLINGYPIEFRRLSWDWTVSTKLFSYLSEIKLVTLEMYCIFPYFFLLICYLRKVVSRAGNYLNLHVKDRNIFYTFV